MTVYKDLLTVSVRSQLLESTDLGECNVRPKQAGENFAEKRAYD